MLEIKLNNSDRVTLIEDCDFNLVSKFSCSLSKKGYVMCWSPTTGCIKLHNLLIGYNFGYTVDHINRNKLDNRRSNLRFVTKSINNRNQDKKLKCTSRFRGVSWHKRSGKWLVQMEIMNKSHYIGIFNDEEDAAIAYNYEIFQLDNHAAMNDTGVNVMII